MARSTGATFSAVPESTMVSDEGPPFSVIHVVEPPEGSQAVQVLNFHPSLGDHKGLRRKELLARAF